jgi:beta-lactamase class D
MRRQVRLAIVSGLLVASHAGAGNGLMTAAQPLETQSCFLLAELGVGEVRRAPSAACQTRVTPASTFKVPHAVAALDAGVVAGPTEPMAYVSAGQVAESARRDHTLATALRHSVVWYFQRLAERLGPERERAYLERFSFGNGDASSGLTTFWIGGSLQVTPEEQLAFWSKLYQGQLAAGAGTMELVRGMLIQPTGVVVNAAGEQAFAQPWPEDAIVSAKTGSATDRSGQGVRWLVGHVARGRRSFVFVSCVVGPPDVNPNAAIDLAARALREADVL